MKDSFKMVLLMDKGSLFGLMEMFMKVNGYKVKNMVKEKLPRLMGIITKANG